MSRVQFKYLFHGLILYLLSTRERLFQLRILDKIIVYRTLFVLRES